MGKRKRVGGEGTISKRRNKAGKVTGWKADVTIGHTADGKAERRWISGKTQDEVREKMQRVAEHNGGTLARTDGMNVAQFLDKWIDHKEHISKIKPKPLLDYRRISDVRIKPAVGNVPLDKLQWTLTRRSCASGRPRSRSGGS